MSCKELQAADMLAYLERSCPSCSSSSVALRSLDLLMGSAKTRLKVDRLPSKSGFTKEIIAACNTNMSGLLRLFPDKLLDLVA